MGVLTLTQIPAGFGSGGSGFTPNQSYTGTDLVKLVTEHYTALKTLDTTGGNPEEISSSGALSTSVHTSRLTVSGTKAYTLADGTLAGQKKRIFCLAASSTPSGVVTPAHASGFTTLTFATANGWIDLEFDMSLSTPAWKITGIAGTVTVT